MVIKTKKYQLDQNTYLKIAMTNILKQWLWIWAIPPAVWAIFWVTDLFWWGFGLALFLIVGYLLFWVVQFVGVSQHERAKALFDRYSYEIDSRQIMLKVNAKQGMPMKWNMVQYAKKTSDSYILSMSRAEFLVLPYEIFRKENDLKLMDNLLKRKNLI